MPHMFHTRLPLSHAMKIVFVAILVLYGLTSVSLANESTDRRIQISLPLFPRIVAVDSKFQDKLTVDKKARLVFVYDRNKTRAKELAKTVGKAIKPILTDPLMINPIIRDFEFERI